MVNGLVGDLLFESFQFLSKWGKFFTQDFIYQLSLVFHKIILFIKRLLVSLFFIFLPCWFSFKKKMCIHFCYSPCSMYTDKNKWANNIMYANKSMYTDNSYYSKKVFMLTIFCTLTVIYTYNSCMLTKLCMLTVLIC